MTTRSPGGLSGHLVDFVDALRRKGIPVGPSEAVDAAAAMVHIDLLDRAALREALAATILHKPTHRGVFDQIFDLWFPAAIGAHSPADGVAVEVEIPTDDDGKVDPDALNELIASLLLEDTEESRAKARALAELLVEQLGSYDSVNGPRYSAYQALSPLDTGAIMQRILDGLMGADPFDPDGSKRHAEKSAAANSAADMVRGFLREVADETRRRTAETVGRDRVADYAVGPAAEQVDFLRANDQDLQVLRRRVGPLARQLGSRLAARRRRHRQGAIDMRKTMRRSMSTGGVPVELVLRKPRPARPELVVLCDVSGSVAGFSHFTLQLVHSLREQFSRVRVFAFVDTTDEVTSFFETGSDLGSAMSRMVREARIITYDGHSDYGHALEGFADRYAHTLTRTGSLLILGDGRNNYRDPSVDALEFVSERVGHTHWLNPEPRKQWGTGDSAARLYSQYVPMHECRNVEQLTAVVAGLLPV
ncbi:von Willebrand factor A [Dietzia sp. UCD-THP]|uniref:vWA domain-containing protein n=1 Tax=Dietzia sp. UCD-THP TaxID=1292020 RepID=UPI00036F903E|nr:VWA domain-containing protein [Dietzia sp. UCD-THP]EYT64492.1 von Willebrand factor A [Dietzia sp. UCD-THP]